MTARQAAYKALERCRRDGAWSTAVIDNIIQSDGLDSRDAALTTAITLGVLQNTEYCDYLIGCFCSASTEKLEKKVLDILRIGAVQLLFLDRIPRRAAVNETVSLCRFANVERATALVNAVLRKMSDSVQHLPEVPGMGTAEYLAVRYSHPLWFAERFTQERGYVFTRDLFRCNNDPSKTDIQINTLRTEAASYLRKLEKRGISYSVPPFPSNCISIDGGSVRQLPGFEEGEFFVQDRAARSAVEIAGIKPDSDVLDVCACPGGKSFAAAMDMCGKGHILSCDINEKKLSVLKEGAERLGIGTISVMHRDARDFMPEFEGRFDTVIADVPCSGFGVIGKKPEIRNKRPEDIVGLPEIQRAIIENVSRYVREGGTLLYSTCTILHEENEDVVRAFLAAHKEFSPEDFSVGGRISDGGCYTFFPNVDGTDGFFVSKLKRIG